MSMEEDSNLRLLLTSSHSALLSIPPSRASCSQASSLVSAIPIGPPPAPCC